MNEITTLADLDLLKATEKGLVILFGGRKCGVCSSIKPKLTTLIAQEYPNMTLAYVDCHLVPEVCSQNGVLSLPTLQVFFEGKCFIEAVRTFSLPNIMMKIQRPYSMMDFSVSSTKLD